MTKQFFASIMVLTLVAMVVGVAVRADDEATVAATVTAELISVSVASGNVDYGVLAVDTSKDTTNLNQTQVVTNNSNVAVDLGVKSSNAVGGIDWNLATTNAGLDNFTHESSPNGSSWTFFDVDNTSYTTLIASVGTGNSQNLDLRIKTPASVSDNVLKTITVTVLATAS